MHKRKPERGVQTVPERGCFPPSPSNQATGQGPSLSCKGPARNWSRLEKTETWVVGPVADGRLQVQREKTKLPTKTAQSVR